MTMLSEIFLHTPRWVFIVFALLLWLGAKQLLTRSVTLARVTLMPLVMTGLAIFGVASAFGDSPFALLAWAIGALSTAAWLQQGTVPPGTRYDGATRRFHLPGSAFPLLLMMSIFLTKYAVAVALALHPALHRDAVFALVVPVLYGVFTGAAAGRALRLWKLAIREDRALNAVGNA